MKNKIRITFISDTHNKHKKITSSLPGGDIIIHAGDVSSVGYEHEIKEFCKWYNSLESYEDKIFIAGNHDWLFQKNPEKSKEILEFYDKITYLQDSQIILNNGSNVKVWGSPWQPEFYDWAFNLPRGKRIAEEWDKIPDDVDILVTHGPAWGKLDRVIGEFENLGCEELAKSIGQKKPKIHVCGHIHSGYGYIFDGETHYINASVLSEQYTFTNKPLTVLWEKETNEIEFL
jgi:Icc-related predicted phosphoesterase